MTVITPCLNAAATLPATLESVRAQRFPGLEHIVVDGGSTDGTVELLGARADPDLVWTSEADRGQNDAVNKGLARITGELVLWVNADNVLLPHAVDAAVALLDARPEVDAVFGGIDIIDEHGVVRRRYLPPACDWRRWLLVGDYVPTETIVFRRGLLDRVPQLDEAAGDAADYDFYLRLFRGARVDRIAEPLVSFRYHPTSKSSSDVWTQLDEAREIRLKWARNPLQRGVMEGWERTRRAVLPRISGWPHPEPRGLVKLLHRTGVRG